MQFSVQFNAVFMLLSNIMEIIAYVFMGIGLMTIAKNRGYDKPWLAWIPFCNVYLLGRVADDVMIRRGKKTSYGKTLLGLEIAVFAILMVLVIGIVFIALESSGWYGFTYDYHYNYYYGDDTSEMLPAVVAVVIILLLFMLAMLVLAVVQIVFLFIALNKIFSDYDPANATLYTVLSVVGSCLSLPLYPVFLFVIRSRFPISIYAPPMPPYYNGYQQPNYGPPYTPPYQQVPPQNYYAPAPPQMPTAAPPYPNQQWQAPPAPPYQPQGWQPAPPPPQQAPPAPPAAPVQPPQQVSEQWNGQQGPPVQ